MCNNNLTLCMFWPSPKYKEIQLNGALCHLGSDVSKIQVTPKLTK